MATNEVRQLGKVIRDARVAAGLTAAEVSRRSGVNVGTISRYEHGLIANPQPATLLPVAAVLGIPTADIFALRRWVGRGDLPSLPEYLRAEFPNLPEAAYREIQEHFDRVATRYGAAGPSRGEDEYE